jgi:hypothetical protein
MKKILLLGSFIFGLVLFADAQRVSVRLNFPGNYATHSPGPAPYRGGVWVGPEWRWERDRYVSAPGYWARPHHRRAVWVEGYWRYSRRGYVWVPGYWR